jgi:hypothetical protein
MKMGVLLGRSPAGKPVLAIWAFRVVPSGLSLRVLDMSLDMLLLAVLLKTRSLDMSESMAVGLSYSLGCIVAARPASTAVYITPPSRGQSCQLPKAARLPVTDETTGRGADPAPVAGRLLAGSFESPNLASSLALRLPACWLEGRWDALGAPPSAVLRLPADTTAFFFRDDRAVLSSLRRPGESCKVKIAFILFLSQHDA